MHKKKRILNEYEYVAAAGSQKTQTKVKKLLKNDDGKEDPWLVDGLIVCTVKNKFSFWDALECIKRERTYIYAIN